MPTWQVMQQHRTASGPGGAQALLVEAVLARDLPTIQALLRRGACLTAKDEFGYSPLNWATAEGCPEVVAVMLLHSGSPLEIIDDVHEAIQLTNLGADRVRPVFKLFAGDDDEAVLRDAVRVLRPKPFILAAVCEYALKHFGLDLNLVAEPDSGSGDKETRYVDTDSDWSKDDSEGSAPRLDWFVAAAHPKLAVRREPTHRSPLLCSKVRGELLALGEFDETRMWRRAYLESEGRGGLPSGWVQVSHPLLGPLVWPLEKGPGHEGEQAAPDLRLKSRRTRRKAAESPQNLVAAVQKQDLPMVEQLLRFDADVNAVDSFGETPLFESVSSGNLAVTATLLLHGADPNVRSSSSSSSGARVSSFATDGDSQVLLAAFDPGRSGARLEREVRKALRDAIASLPSDILKPMVWTLRHRSLISRAEAKAWDRLDSAIEEHPPVAVEAPDNPPGLYQVTFRPRIAVYGSPRTCAPLRHAYHGACLELGGWDATGSWMCCMERGAVTGWVLPQHPLFGPLVRLLRKTPQPGEPRSSSRKASRAPSASRASSERRGDSVPCRVHSRPHSRDAHPREPPAAPKSELMDAVRHQNLQKVLACLKQVEAVTGKDAAPSLAPLLDSALKIGDVDILAALLLAGVRPEEPLRAHDAVLDVQARTLLQLFAGLPVDAVAKDDVLAALDAELGSAVLRRLGEAW